MKRIDLLAETLDIVVTSVDIKTERKKWKEQLKKLKRWSDIRNSATGHYDRDTARQIELVKTLNANEVLEVALAFLRCNRAVLKCFANVVYRHGA